MKCLYCLNCPEFGQLIIRKIIRIVANRCQILGVKMYKIRFRPQTTPFGKLTALLRWWSLQRSPDPWRRRRRGGKVNEREKEGRRKEFGPLQSSPQIDATASGARSLAGRLFQIQGPWTAKLRSPYFVLVLGMTSCLVCAERR